MIKELIKIANELDKRGLVKEADALDEIINNDSLPESKEDDAIGSKIKDMLASPGGQEVLEKYNLNLDEEMIDGLIGSIINLDLKTLVDKLMALTIGIKKAHRSSSNMRKHAGPLSRSLEVVTVTIKDIVGIVKYLIGPSPLWKKGLVAALTAAVGAGYLVFPFDIIPDFIPAVGQLDDILVYIKAFTFIASKLDSENWSEAHGSAEIEAESEEETPDILEEAEELSLAENVV
jgi:uncharacterized membrane protein YkvA (DUF1232 family)